MRVKKAEYVQDYKIKMVFSDGAIKVVDFKPFLKDAKNLFIPLIDIEYFKRFYVDDTTICWPNEVDFCPDVLHEIGEEVQEPQKTAKSRYRKRVAIVAHAMVKKRPKHAKR